MSHVTNIDVSNGLSIGARGIVTKIITCQEQVQHILLTFENPDVSFFQLFSCCQDDALNRLTTDGMNPRSASYNEMVELSEREFGPRECKSSYIMELNQGKQKMGESARELGNRITRLASIALTGKDHGFKLPVKEWS